MSGFDGMTFETLPEALAVGVQSEKFDYMVLDKLERRITARATMAGKFNVILDLGKVEFIPSMLMSVLVKTLKSLGDQGRKACKHVHIPLIHIWSFDSMAVVSILGMMLVEESRNEDVIPASLVAG